MKLEFCDTRIDEALDCLRQHCREPTPAVGYGVSETAASGVAMWKLKLSSM